jgi:hypothetical protein
LDPKDEEKDRKKEEDDRREDDDLSCFDALRLSMPASCANARSMFAASCLLARSMANSCGFLGVRGHCSDRHLAEV